MILRPSPNQPLTLSLKYTRGKEKNSGTYGLQFEYVTTAGEILYLPPVAKEELDALHLDSGEPFTLTKTIGAGNQAEWKIERASKPENANGAKGSPPRRPIVSSTAINGESIKDEPLLTTAESQRLYRQLVASIDAVQAAEIHAKQIQFPLTFTSEDIRALAISCFIQQSQDKGRRVA